MFLLDRYLSLSTHLLTEGSFLGVVYGLVLLMAPIVAVVLLGEYLLGTLPVMRLSGWAVQYLPMWTVYLTTKRVRQRHRAEAMSAAEWMDGFDDPDSVDPYLAGRARILLGLPWV